MFNRLYDELHRQREQTPGAIVLVDEDDGEATVGEKRNRLLRAARETGSSHTVFVDDDDEIAPDYLSSIILALDSDPDAVGFRSERYRDGKLWGMCTYSAHWPHERDTMGQDGIMQVRRWPCHITPIRTSLAPDFNPWNFDEDRSYAATVRKKIRREHAIDKVLYRYLMRSRAERQFERVHPTRWTESHRPKIEAPLSALY